MKTEEPKAIEPSQPDIQSRRKCVKQLYLLGFSLRDIATYTGINYTTVTNDFRHLTDKEKANHPRTAIGAFKAQFYYFEGFIGIDQSTFKGAWATIYTTLVRSLNIEDLMLLLNGMAETMNRLAVPSMTPKQARYYMLFARDVFMYASLDISADAILSGYYAAVKTGTAKIPDSRERLFSAIADWFIAKSRKYALPSLPDSFLTDVTNALSRLSARERRILEMRYGLDGSEPKTLEEISGLFTVTRERIRQIEAKAIRKLGTSKRKKMLLHYFQPYNVFTDLKDQMRIIERKKADLQKVKELPREWSSDSDKSILSEPIEYLELSARAHIRIKGIAETVGELTKCTERDLMDLRHFGSASFKNVIQRLAAYGLQLREKE